MVIGKVLSNTRPGGFLVPLKLLRIEVGIRFVVELRVPLAGPPLFLAGRGCPAFYNEVT